MPKVTVVIAFLNEENNLGLLKQRLLAVYATAGVEIETILVDDHSWDRSSEIARAWAVEDSRVHYLRLARNCGQHAALSAGLHKATGNCAIFLAADLQDPPEVIPDLLAKWAEGNQVVWVQRAKRLGESWITRFFSRIYWWLLRFGLPNAPLEGIDSGLIDRRVLEVYNSISEKNTSLFGLILWIGFRQTSVQWVKQPRHEGKSKFVVARKLKVFVDSMISFSTLPVRFLYLAGTGLLLLGFLFAGLVLVKFLRGLPLDDGSCLTATVLVLGGFQVSMLGLVGEYLGRIYDEARNRPRYVIEDYFHSSEVERRQRLESSLDKDA